MRPFSFPGTYSDSRGEESIVWRVDSSRRRQRPADGPGFELHTTIRDVPCWGYDFDSLEPVDPENPDRNGLSLGPHHGELDECVLTGELPCKVDIDGTPTPSVVRFSLDLRESARSNVAAPRNLTLAIDAGNSEIEVADDWFEDGILRLDALMPAPTRIRCCVTCLYSDYSPGGHGLTGMSCHRDAKEQYLAVRSKHDYWSVPVTEEVMETYVCPEYQRRIPGTGYRG